MQVCLSGSEGGERLAVWSEGRYAQQFLRLRNGWLCSRMSVSFVPPFGMSRTLLPACIRFSIQFTEFRKDRMRGEIVPRGI